MTAGYVTDRTHLSILLVCAAALFAAGMSQLSLPSLDDAFYARKGVEMARGGPSFTVTWAGGTGGFQNPPFHIWLLAASVAVLGEGDLAARLPSLLLACGTLLLTFRIGTRLTNPGTGLAGVACLIASPIFVTSGRGCMLDLPLTFWTSLVLLLFIEGRERPWLHVAVALPLAAAILTKSVAGLLAVAIMALVSVHPEWRPRRAGLLILGVALGVAFGSSWMIHQGITFGLEAVSAHATEIGARAGASSDLRSVMFDYPVLLLSSYQPIIVPGMLGLVALLRNRQRWTGGDVLLLAWLGVPVLLYSTSAVGAPRYLHPILPPLALLAGQWLRRTVPVVERPFTTRVVPGVALVAAAIFVVSPTSLTRDLNGPFKQYGQLVANAPTTEPIPYVGARYWELANPMLYYAERMLTPAADPAAAVAAASEHPLRLLLCDRDRLADIRAVGPPTRIVVEGARWALLELGRSASNASPDRERTAPLYPRSATHAR